MADKNAEITALDLQGGLNLNTMRSEIRAYNSGLYNEKNSLFYGNKLTNWHKNIIPNDVFRQYKGKPIYVSGSFVNYNGKTYEITGGDITVEETEYFPSKEVYAQDGYVYVGNTVIGTLPYAGYLSVTKRSSTLWFISVIPFSPTSILDFVTFRVTVSGSGDNIIVGGVDEKAACLIHAETGYGVYVPTPTDVFATVKFGYVKDGSDFDSLWTDLEQVEIQFGTATYASGVEAKDANNYHADFTILATKHYIQCTFDEGIKPNTSQTVFVRNTGFFSDGFRFLNDENSPALFGITGTVHNGYKRDIVLTTDGSKAWWSGGVKVPLKDNFNSRTFDVLYNYSGIIEGISINNSWIVRDVDEIVSVFTETNAADVVTGYTLTYKYKDKYYKITRIPNSLNKRCYVVKNFLCYITDAYYNTIDLDTGKLFCRSDDYNNRAFPTCHLPSSIVYKDQGSGDNQLYQKKNYYFVAEQTLMNSGEYEVDNNTITAILYASAVNEMYYADNIVNPSTIEAPITLSVNFTEDDFKKNIKTLGAINVFGPIDENIDIFFPNVYGGLPLYFESLGGKTVSASLSFGVTGYPMTTDSNSLYNLTVLDMITDTYLNQCIIVSQNYSTFTVMDNKLNPVLAYYLLSMVEFSNVFIMQGTYYACSGDYIIRLTLTNGVVTGTDVVANIKDLQFIGSTTNEAYFYSLFDKSLYAFTGDFNLTKQIEVTAVNHIYNTYNNPAIGLIAVTTDIGLVVMYQGQICLLKDSTDSVVYYDDKCIINGHIRYSLDERENFIKEPVILETELYGIGGEVKSVNDCVYIRLYSENPEMGKVRITSKTLNEISKISESKEFKVNVGDWDKETGTMFIRYQPKNQAATGFAFKIESDFGIATISISHKAEAIQNATHNL